MSNYGIKVVTAGSDINTTDTREIIMSSKYSMFKYPLIDTYGTVTVSTGGTAGTATISHNLGYVPSFIAYSEQNNGISSLPYSRITIAGTLDYNDIYADGTNVYITQRYKDPVGQENYNASDFWNTYFGDNVSCYVGNISGDSSSGAMRFNYINLDKNESITDAYINFYVGVKGSNSNYLKLKTYGIDEDNTSGFNDPMGRNKTSAVTNQTTICPQAGENFTINVKSQVEEIIARSGWSNGNALGFLIYDDGSNNDVNAYDALVGISSMLTIVKSSSLTTTYRIIVFKDKII